MTADELRLLRNTLSTHLDNHLGEMKEGFDDSITGFNEAWDVMRNLLNEKIADLAKTEKSE